jgi:hypothetical protein
MWASGDELDTEVETSSESSPAYDSGDEVLDDAPPEGPAEPDAAPGRRSNARRLQDSLGTILDQNQQGSATRDRTLQAFLRQLGGQGTDYDRWVQQGHGLQVKDLTEWEESQRRLLTELETTLYERYCEAERTKAQIQQHQAQQAHQHPQPQPFSPPQPAQATTQPTAQPTPLTHADKLSALLTRTANLKQALSTTKDLIIQHELHSAQHEHRRTRIAEITSFFTNLTATIDRAATTIQSFHREAKKRNQTGGDFQWIPSAELEFCAAWEGVVGGYLDVWNLERAVVFRIERGCGMGDEWERYLVALGRFGEGVRGFGEGIWGMEEQK